MMRTTTLLLVTALVMTLACGASHRPAPNDEVTTHMTASDEAALDRPAGEGDQDGPAGADDQDRPADENADVDD
jgi:hypothetical protein